MLRFAILLVVSTAALAATAAQQRQTREETTIERELRGLVPGRPQACIATSRTLGSTHSGNTVLLRDRNGTRFLSRFRGGCTLREDEALILRTTSTQLCSGEIVQGRDLFNGVSSGACAYGDFTPYRRAPARGRTD